MIDTTTRTGTIPPTAEIRTDRRTIAVADGTTMPAYVARPVADVTARAGLIVLQEAFGVNAHIRDVNERFARAGYLAIAPALFHRTDGDFEGDYTDFERVRPHMQAVTDDGLTADLKATYDYLAGEKVTAIGTVGYCMGGRAAFLADILLPLRAAGSYYGGGIGPNTRGRADLTGRAGDLSGPLLLVWGGKDGGIPPEQTRAVEDALRAAGKPYTQVTFSQADHGFFCDQRASYEPEAARLSWGLTLAFLADHLGT